MPAPPRVSPPSPPSGAISPPDNPPPLSKLIFKSFRSNISELVPTSFDVEPSCSPVVFSGSVVFSLDSVDSSSVEVDVKFSSMAFASMFSSWSVSFRHSGVFPPNYFVSRISKETEFNRFGVAAQSTLNHQSHTRANWLKTVPFGHRKLNFWPLGRHQCHT
ncbi:unnamed protein product [Acanthoscelides obtectus]|uniref:Uncharacterized protein n=1 Tax=Acanthoscelides obtectus TaxID=200917 RepID=A0A9P0MAS4_ACAOB|nr:unnamed protein product [Acanthoscelides obtectus]CAK1658595.1 hypothetical protein AOBTE_LOCUS21011 [Acanthoscelides obtectus]